MCANISSSTAAERTASATACSSTAVVAAAAPPISCGGAYTLYDVAGAAADATSS